MTQLRYVGDGRFVVGIPTTDLTVAEVAVLAEQLGVAVAELERTLVESGLYQAKPPKSAEVEK